jgi:hypothetical protein
MGLTLLAQSELPPQYWVDSFLTSVFLINKLPTPKHHTFYFTKPNHNIWTYVSLVVHVIRF